MNTNRRDFLRAGATLAVPAVASRSLAASDRVRVAMIGVRNRGKYLMTAVHELARENVEIAALCDPNKPVLDERLGDYEKMSGKHVPGFADMRHIFDDKSIDAVVVATPDHWHTLAAVWACQAGKDVYVEKPGSHCFWEGRKVIEAAAKYKRMVQHGTQNRSSPNIMEAVQKLRDGVIGKVYMARVISYKLRPSIGSIPPGAEPVPAGFDWERWQGPAPARPYSANRHKGWMWLWEYGNGEIANQAVHELDIMRWALGLDTHPSRVVSTGGMFIHDDSQECPNMQSVLMEYPGRKLMITVESRGWYTNGEGGMGIEYPFVDKRNVVGNLFFGSEGYMVIPDYTSYYTFLGAKRTPGPSRVGDGSLIELPHIRNFTQAIRSRNPAELHAPPLELHLSCALPHLANISYRLGRELRFDHKTETIPGDQEANRLLRHGHRAPYIVPDRV
jgi:predicted dehydrogenase